MTDEQGARPGTDEVTAPASASGAPDTGLPTVTVVVPTHKRRSYLPQCLAPLLGDPATTQLVVVVDRPATGEDDGSAGYVRSLQAEDPRVTLVEVTGAGSTGSNEEGLDVAEGEVVLFIDDDVVADPGLVTGHARRHAEAEGLVVVGHMPTTVPTSRAPGQFATRFYAQEYLGRVASWRDSGDEAVLCNLWMGNISMRTADARRVGLRGDGTFTVLRHGDRDFGLRCLLAGLHGIYDPALISRHVHHRPLHRFRSDSRSQGAGRAVLAERYPGLVEDPDALQGLPTPVRAVIDTAVGAPVETVLTGALSAAVRMGGALHLWPVEDAAAKLLRRVEQHAGMQEVRRLGAGRGVGGQET